MTPPPVSRFGKLAQSLGLWRRVVALLGYSSRRLSVAVLGLTFFEIIFTLGGLLMIKGLVERMASSADLRADANTILTYVAVILGLFLAARLTQAGAQYARAAQGFVVTDYVNHAIQERAVNADLSFFDSALYYDNLERARQAGAGRPAQVIANAINALRAGLMLGGIVIILLMIEWILLPVSLVAVALILLVQLRFTRERFHLQRRLVQTERHGLYADYLMTSEPFAKEIRLWHIGPYLQRLYMQVRVALRGEYLGIERRKALAESGVAVIGAALFAAAGGLLIWRFSTGQASISDLVIVMLLLLRAETAGRDFVANLSRLYDDQLFLNQIFTFLDLQPHIETSAATRPVPEIAPTSDGVRLSGVSFAYPGTEKPALRDVSLQIRPGRFTALVGGNGSGKTTLIKLLCRLYDPQHGAVTLDGTDIRDFDPVAYRRRFSVIFQDFVQFAFSGRDNLRLADLGETPDDARFEAAARLTGADEVLGALPQGYDTVLSRMFDGGVELSGGQWQKVALARALYPASDFVILDEPTSAIDPNAEAALFEGFRDKLDGRGALVISHRLSTIRMADYTYVLEDGRIIEEGTHDALIAQGGHYAGMFERQGRGYRE